MQYVFPLLANTGDSGGLIWTLFWLVLMAGVIWLLIWRLLREDSNSTGEKESARILDNDKPEGDSNDEGVESEAGGGRLAAAEIRQEEKAGAETASELDTATAEEAAARFKAELESGAARQNEALGILYTSAPEDVDDLKEIKGVATVLEGKLHEFGIYRFKQIALWTDTAVAEFAERLSFRDRIYRDDWVAQAKAFHQVKYGEHL